VFYDNLLDKHRKPGYQAKTAISRALSVFFYCVFLLRVNFSGSSQSKHHQTNRIIISRANTTALFIALPSTPTQLTFYLYEALLALVVSKWSVR
jgi:hypothetical protein